LSRTERRLSDGAIRYIPHTDADVRRMLDRVGAQDLEALFAPIPDKLRLSGELDLPAPLGEYAIARRLQRLAARNANPTTHDWFLGAGCYAHFVPAAVDAIASRSEFYTAYTPYQAEISQGTLQTIFEWQTMICSLVGLEVSNASLYDGASAAAEAALMAMRVTRRARILAAGLHPHYRAVLDTYLSGIDAEIDLVPRAASGASTLAAELVDTNTACIVLQHPNFWGCLEDVRGAAELAHQHGALLVVVVSEAASLALLRAPGELGADIVCGEAQSFGVPVSFGGPALGFLAVRQKHVRQMPGRLCGETVDAAGKRGFVLTLSTREQHIRREKATSNICTNQGLCLLMATVYLALMGRRGLREWAQLNFAKAEYAKSQVRGEPALDLLFEAPTFNEFAVGVPDSARAALERAEARGAIGGLDLEPYAPELGSAVLVCVTELAERAAVDRLIAALAGRRAA